VVVYFGGGLVGEGDREDVVGGYVHDLVELVDVVREYAGFVGIGVGEY